MSFSIRLTPEEKSLAEILANKAFWDEDLSFLYDEVAKYDNK